MQPLFSFLYVYVSVSTPTSQKITSALPFLWNSWRKWVFGAVFIDPGYLGSFHWPRVFGQFSLTLGIWAVFIDPGYLGSFHWPWVFGQFSLTSTLPSCADYWCRVTGHPWQSRSCQTSTPERRPAMWCQSSWPIGPWKWREPEPGNDLVTARVR